MTRSNCQPSFSPLDEFNLAINSILNHESDGKIYFCQLDSQYHSQWIIVNNNEVTVTNTRKTSCHATIMSSRLIPSLPSCHVFPYTKPYSRSLSMPWPRPCRTQKKTHKKERSRLRPEHLHRQGWLIDVKVTACLHKVISTSTLFLQHITRPTSTTYSHI